MDIRSTSPVAYDPFLREYDAIFEKIYNNPIPSPWPGYLAAFAQALSHPIKKPLPPMVQQGMCPLAMLTITNQHLRALPATDPLSPLKPRLRQLFIECRDVLFALLKSRSKNDGGVAVIPENIKNLFDDYIHSKRTELLLPLGWCHNDIRIGNHLFFCHIKQTGAYDHQMKIFDPSINVKEEWHPVSEEGQMLHLNTVATALTLNVTLGREEICDRLSCLLLMHLKHKASQIDPEIFIDHYFEQLTKQCRVVEVSQGPLSHIEAIDMTGRCCFLTIQAFLQESAHTLISDQHSEICLKDACNNFFIQLQKKAVTS